MASADIYYFSGTGNSLIVARDLANNLNGKLLSIPSALQNDTFQTDADIIGLVFPVYLGGIPRIVRRFVKQLSNINSKYIFSVCTYRNTTGAIYEILPKAIKSRNGRLSAGFAVKMPGYYIVEKDAISTEEQQKLFNDWKNKLIRIVEFINLREEGEFEKYTETNDVLGNIILSSQLINRFLSKMYETRDKQFYVNDKCTGCGICARVCPVNNIQIIEDKPQWFNNCEQCFACLQWFPREAIQYKIHYPFIRPGGMEANMTENRKRYHHPNVKVSEMFVR